LIGPNREGAELVTIVDEGRHFDKAEDIGNKTDFHVGGEEGVI
jgi:hypothetical protein